MALTGGDIKLVSPYLDLIEKQKTGYVFEKLGNTGKDGNFVIKLDSFIGRYRYLYLLIEPFKCNTLGFSLLQGKKQGYYRIVPGTGSSTPINYGSRDGALYGYIPFTNESYTNIFSQYGKIGIEYIIDLSKISASEKRNATFDITIGDLDVSQSGEAFVYATDIDVVGEVNQLADKTLLPLRSGLHKSIDIKGYPNTDITNWVRDFDFIIFDCYREDATAFTNVRFVFYSLTSELNNITVRHALKAFYAKTDDNFFDVVNAKAIEDTDFDLIFTPEQPMKAMRFVLDCRKVLIANIESAFFRLSIDFENIAQDAARQLFHIYGSNSEKLKYFFEMANNGGGAEPVFDADFLVSLQGTKTYGKYLNGETVPAAGKTARQVLIDIANEYINPVFTSFTTTTGSTTVEVGTVVSGSHTFTWAINSGSGTVAAIDIVDVTDGNTVLALNTPNDGTQSVVVKTVTLNTPGANQQWRGVGKNSNPTGTFNSGIYTRTARYRYFFGAISATPTDSAGVRAMPTNGFHTGGGNITLNTGNTAIKFGVALPPSVTLISAIDLDASNAAVNYELVGTILVNDAGGTPRTYNYYEANIAIPYTSNHRHQIAISA